jgi:hypothetical protein
VGNHSHKQKPLSKEKHSLLTLVFFTFGLQHSQAFGALSVRTSKPDTTCVAQGVLAIGAFPPQRAVAGVTAFARTLHGQIFRRQRKMGRGKQRLSKNWLGNSAFQVS